MGEAAKAEPAFARATRLEPRNFEAQFGHGQALRALERFRDALRAYQQALAVEPNDVDALSALAATFLELDRPRSAIAPAERVAELDPDDGDAFAMLGTAYVLAGRTDEAIDTYEIAIELIGNEPELIGNLVECYASEGRFQESVNGQVLLSLALSAIAWERQDAGSSVSGLRGKRRLLSTGGRPIPTTGLHSTASGSMPQRLALRSTSVEARDEAVDSFRAAGRQPRSAEGRPPVDHHGLDPGSRPRDGFDPRSPSDEQRGPVRRAAGQPGGDPYVEHRHEEFIGLSHDRASRLAPSRFDTSRQPLRRVYESQALLHAFRNEGVSRRSRSRSATTSPPR